ncbi:MAG: hypothetical protein RSC68_32100 [Acinetobacter sp.]
MAKYSYTYSGSNAAFVLSGICTLPSGISVVIEEKDHKALSKNKFVKHLLEADELKIEEIQEEAKPATGGRGKGAQGKGANKVDESKGDELTIDDVRTALTDLEITYTEDETLEQLQAKLVQATE